MEEVEVDEEAMIGSKGHASKREKVNQQPVRDDLVCVIWEQTCHVAGVV